MPLPTSHSPSTLSLGRDAIEPLAADQSSSSSSSGLRGRFDPRNLFNVEGMVVVITGAGTGIGLMMATALEHNGATVYIIGRRGDVLKKAAKENNKYGRIIPIEGDITKRESLLGIVDVIKAQHGYVDLLVNNAGIARNLYQHPLPSPYGRSLNDPPSPPDSPPSGPITPSIKAFQNALWDTGSPDEWAETFETNTTAPYYTTVAFLDLLHQGNLRKQREEHPTGLVGAALPRPPYHSSQVICISSSGAFRTDAKVLSPSYTLSKSACLHLGKLLANLLAPWGIRSNVLAPGVFPSEMTTSPTPNIKLDPSVLAESVPMRRVGSEEDMAGTILFLASQASAYVNGAVWLVDGGRVVSLASAY